MQIKIFLNQYSEAFVAYILQLEKNSFEKRLFTVFFKVTVKENERNNSLKTTVFKKKTSSFKKKHETLYEFTKINN